MHVLTRALVLCSLASSVAAAQDSKSFSYTPGTQRYRLTTVVNNQRDQTGGRAPMTYTVTTTQIVTVTLARKTADTLALTIHIDSADVDSPDLDSPKPDLSFERGVTLKGTIAPTGHIYEFGSKADAATLNGSNIAALYKSFQHFLPAFPGADVHVGLTWSDTSEQRELHRSSFDSVITRVVTLWKVSSDTTIAGSHAWRLDRSSTIDLTGDGKEAGQPIHLDGDGSIKSAAFVNPAGIYLGTRSSQNVRFVNSFKETGEGAPQSQTIKTTIEALPPIRTAQQ